VCVCISSVDLGCLELQRPPFPLLTTPQVLHQRRVQLVHTAPTPSLTPSSFELRAPPSIVAVQCSTQVTHPHDATLRDVRHRLRGDHRSYAHRRLTRYLADLPHAQRSKERDSDPPDERGDWTWSGHSAGLYDYFVGGGVPCHARQRGRTTSTSTGKPLPVSFAGAFSVLTG
jgi:hypothetical protein